MTFKIQLNAVMRIITEIAAIYLPSADDVRRNAEAGVTPGPGGGAGQGRHRPEAAVLGGRPAARAARPCRLRLPREDAPSDSGPAVGW